MERKSDSPVYSESYYRSTSAPERYDTLPTSAAAFVLVALVCGLLIIVGYPGAVIPAVLALVVYWRMED